MLKVAIIICVCGALGKMMLLVRNPYFLASTKEIIANLSKMGVFLLGKTLVKKYILYMTVMLSILMILLVSLYKLSKQKKSSEHKSSVITQNYDKVIFVLLLLICSFLVCYCLVQRYFFPHIELNKEIPSFLTCSKMAH